MSIPFTPEVTRSLDYLRQGIAEVSSLDEDLSETMTAIVDDMIVNLENQLMLMFANFNVKESERRDLLLKQQQHPSVLAYYNEVKESQATQQRRVLSPRDPAPSSPTKGLGPTTTLDNSSAFLTGMNETGFAPVSPAPGASSGGGTVVPSNVPPEVEAHRSLSTALYLLTESLAHTVQAERCMVYLAHKGSGTLRVVTSVPDIGPVQRGAFVATHAGVQGSVFSTGVGIRLDTIDAETMKNYVKPTDNKLGVHTVNSLTFPILDRHRSVIGVVECANRIHQSPWSEVDESLVFHAAKFMQYYLSNFEEIDFFASQSFNPATLHFVTPYQPAPLSHVMMEFPGARDARNPQLIARVQDASQVPIAVKGANQPATEAADTVKSILQVKEIQCYLDNIDVSYRHSMSDLVAGKIREEHLQDEIAKKAHRIRVLESNVNFLHEQLSTHVGGGNFHMPSQALEDSASKDAKARDRSNSRSQSVFGMTTLAQQLNLDASGSKQFNRNNGSKLDSSTNGGGGGGGQLALSTFGTGGLQNASFMSASVLDNTSSGGKGVLSTRPGEASILSGSGGLVHPGSLATKEELYQNAKQTLAALKTLTLDNATAVQRGALLSSPKAKAAHQLNTKRTKSVVGPLAPLNASAGPASTKTSKASANTAALKAKVNRSLGGTQTTNPNASMNNTANSTLAASVKRAKSAMM